MILYDQAGAANHLTQLWAPPADLRHAVEYLWLLDRSPPTHSTWRIVPDPAPHLIVAWTPERIRSFIVGPRTRFVDGRHGRRTRTFGVRLRPGVLARWISAPAGELQDRSVELHALGERWSQSLHDEIEAATEVSQVVERVTSSLRERLGSTELDWRVRGFDALSRGSDAKRGDVSSLCASMGVSARSLRDRFRVDVGIGPKHTARIYRLYRAIDLGMTARLSWSRIAVEAGFSDQAHLIRESKHLLGETPGLFMARGGGMPESSMPRDRSALH